MSSVIEMPLKHFRAKLARGAGAVEREGGKYGYGAIYGVSVITRGEALGHDMWIDEQFLADTTAAINRGESGIKARFTHPGLSSDGIGKYLGRITDARMEGNKVLADLHFQESATKTPDGNLADYVMQLAEDDPQSFGLSIVFDVNEEQMTQHREEHTFGKPAKFVSPDEENKNNYPHARMSSLRAADAVDSPAANPDGLFHREQEIAQDADGLFAFALGLSADQPQLRALSVDPDRVRAAVVRFMDRHGLTLQKGSEPMANTAPAGDPAPIPQLTREDFAAECKRFIAAFGAKGGEWFADGKTYGDCQDLLIAELRAQLSAKDEQLAELQQRLAAIDLGEPSPAKFADNTSPEKPQARSLNAGVAQRIRMPQPAFPSAN